MRDQHDIPVLLTGCLAVGGAGMFLIMSVLIGFGVSTLIGREAMYLCLLLELVNPQVRCCAAEKRRSPRRKCACCAA